MAARAAGGEQGVIDPHRGPGERSMTAVALLRRLDMVVRLADGQHCVVAGRAGMRCGCRPVVEAGRRPGVGGMTALAGGAGGQMARGLALRDRAVVTARARTEHLAVIDTCHRQPGDGRMAALAGVARGDMARALAAAAGRGVAGDARRSDYARMAERSGRW